MEHGPQGPEGGDQHEAGVDEAAEAARAAASRERRADREKLERYVELGLDPGDAEALIEFEHLSPEQRAAWAGLGGKPPDDASTEEVAEPVDGALVARETTPESESPLRPSPRIYVADLAAYTRGRAHGVWLDATRDVEELEGEVRAMLAASPVPGAEEYAIHDSEDFGGYLIGEYEGLAFVHRLASGIAEHGQAFAAYADWLGLEDEELARFGEHYEGTFPTREAWAAEVADEIFEWPAHRQRIPEPLRAYVTLDIAGLTLELEQDRYVVAGDEGVHVFNPHA